MIEPSVRLLVAIHHLHSNGGRLRYRDQIVKPEFENVFGTFHRLRITPILTGRLEDMLGIDSTRPGAKTHLMMDISYTAFTDLDVEIEPRRVRQIVGSEAPF